MSLFFGIQCQARARADSGALDLSNAMQMQRQNLENWGTSVIVKGKTVSQAFSMAHPRIISVLAPLLNH